MNNQAQAILEARGALQGARVAYEQAIRDASALGRSATDIADDLGVKSRSALSRIIGESTPANVTPVGLPLSVLLPEEDWGWEEEGVVRSALNARGWYVTGDELSAWRLSRVGARTVRVIRDYSKGDIRVELAEATLAGSRKEERSTIADLLPDGAASSLAEKHPKALQHEVITTSDRGGWRILKMFRIERHEGTGNFEPEEIAMSVVSILL